MSGTDVDPIRKPINKITPSDDAPVMSFTKESSKEDNSELHKEIQSLKDHVQELETKLEAERNENQKLTERVKELEGKLAQVASASVEGDSTQTD